MSSKIRRNHETDLVYVLRFTKEDADGNFVPISIPDDNVDFDIEHFTDQGYGTTFSVSRINGKYEHCQKLSDSELKVYIPLSQKYLGLGNLCRKLRLRFPEQGWNGDAVRICIPRQTEYYIWDGPTDNFEISEEQENYFSTVFKGDDGFSPIVKVATDAPDVFKLSITSKEGCIETPNLKPQITQDSGDSTGATISQAAITRLINHLQSQLDTLVDGNADGVINAFREIEAFLAGITDRETLTGLLADLRQQIEAAMPRTLTPVAVTQTPLTVAGGNAYHYTGSAAIAVSGAGVFSAVADSAVLTVPANVSVTFGAAFKLMDGLSALTGSTSQHKTYTILRVPVGTNTYALEVNGAIYGV